MDTSRYSDSDITDKHSKTSSLLMRIWFHKRGLQTLLAHKAQMVKVSRLTKFCCWQVADTCFLISNTSVTDWTLQIWWNRPQSYYHVFFYFIIQPDIVLMFGNFSLTWQCYFYCFSQQAASNFQLHHFELTQKLKWRLLLQEHLQFFMPTEEICWLRSCFFYKLILQPAQLCQSIFLAMAQGHGVLIWNK